MRILPDSKKGASQGPGEFYKINLMICSLTTRVERMKFTAQRYIWDLRQPLIYNLIGNTLQWKHVFPVPTFSQEKPVLITRKTCSHYRDPVHIVGNLFSKQVVPCKRTLFYPLQDCSVPTLGRLLSIWILYSSLSLLLTALTFQPIVVLK